MTINSAGIENTLSLEAEAPPQQPPPVRIHWLRALYLANCLMAVLLLVVFIFGIRIPSIYYYSLPDYASISLGYLLIAVVLILIDRLDLQIETNPSSGFFQFLRSFQRLRQNLYSNAGARWHDLGLAVLALLVIGATWYSETINIAILLMGGLALFNSLLSALQPRPTLPEESLRVMQADRGTRVEASPANPSPERGEGTATESDDDPH